MTRKGYEVNVPFTVNGRNFYIGGEVLESAGDRPPRVHRFEARDQRTNELVELPHWARDAAEQELVDERNRLWSTP